MSRDYKGAATARRSSSGGGFGTLLLGMVIGLLLGLGIALAAALYLSKGANPFSLRGKAADPPPASSKADGRKGPAREDPPKDAKPRFEFYDILPGTKDSVGGAKDAPKDAPKDVAKAPPKSAPEPKEAFFLQVGAFQSSAEADNLKARLALLGVEALLQQASTPDKGVIHRVRVGPYSTVEDVNRVRENLKQNGIDTTLIRMRDVQP